MTTMDFEQSQARARARKDEELLGKMAELAECAETAEFARKALAGLVAMGMDPEKTQLSTRVAAAYGRQTGSYLESAAAFPTPGAPMLRAILELGADPEAGAKPGDLTPLMHAVSSRSMDSILALSEAGADWTHRVTRGIYARGAGLGQSPAERLLGSSPYRGGMSDKTQADRAWERACEMAIGGLTTPALAEAGLAALTLGDVESGALSRRVMKKLAKAGASAAGKVIDARGSGWPGKWATPAALAAHLAGQGEADRLADTLAIFPAASEPKSMGALLSAMGMGMISAAAEGGFQTGAQWLSAKEAQALAKSLALSDPLSSCEIGRGQAGPSFARALGAICRPETCVDAVFERMADFWGAWLKESELAGAELDAGAIAEEMAKGVAGVAPLNLEKDRGFPWPSGQEIKQALAKAERLLSASPKLAAERERFDDAWAQSWAEAAQAGLPERAGARAKKRFASFLEGVGERLEGWGPKDPAERQRVWEALSEAAAKAASGLQGGELARMERFSALAASAAPAKASRGPRARI